MAMKKEWNNPGTAETTKTMGENASTLAVLDLDRDLENISKPGDSLVCTGKEKEKLEIRGDYLMNGDILIIPVKDGDREGFEPVA